MSSSLSNWQPDDNSPLVHRLAQRLFTRKIAQSICRSGQRLERIEFYVLQFGCDRIVPAVSAFSLWTPTPKSRAPYRCVAKHSSACERRTRERAGESSRSPNRASWHSPWRRHRWRSSICGNKSSASTPTMSKVSCASAMRRSATWLSLNWRAGCCARARSSNSIPYAPGGSIDDLVSEGLLHSEGARAGINARKQTLRTTLSCSDKSRRCCRSLRRAHGYGRFQ